VQRLCAFYTQGRFHAFIGTADGTDLSFCLTDEPISPSSLATGIIATIQDSDFASISRSLITALQDFDYELDACAPFFIKPQ
jgi:hypothetical protein